MNETAYAVFAHMVFDLCHPGLMSRLWRGIECGGLTLT